MPYGIYPHGKLSESHKLSLSISHKKHPQSSWFKKGVHPSVSTEFKAGHMDGKVVSKELIRKRLIRRKISRLEEAFNEVVINHNLPYKFVGNGEFFIERKNPDFVNINGKKIAIEVYYRRHKELFRGGVETWKKERYDVFREYGWKLLFFDETQVNQKYILDILGETEITGGK